MSYVIAVRNPRSKKLMFVTDEAGEPAEFETEDEAETTARGVLVCQAWPYEIIEIPPL